MKENRQYEQNVVVLQQYLRQGIVSGLGDVLGGCVGRRVTVISGRAGTGYG
jgi:hypothetical protein